MHLTEQLTLRHLRWRRNLSQVTITKTTDFISTHKNTKGRCTPYLSRIDSEIASIQSQSLLKQFIQIGFESEVMSVPNWSTTMPHSSSKVRKTHIKDPLGVMTFEYNLSAGVQQSSSYLQCRSMERFLACTHILTDSNPAYHRSASRGWHSRCKI